MYKPPFTITNKMINLVISITENVEKIKAHNFLNRMPILRKNNKIKSVYSSLKIEANSLSLNQVKDVINGKIVIGPKREIQEVKNAYNAYEALKDFDLYSENDLLKAHKMLTDLIIDDAGKYRNHPEGVFDGEKVIFVAPPEDLVPSLMKDLFIWLKEDDETHLLIKSCIFHYEFVFIHPFSDGNGRLSRLWQNVILCKWNPIFEYIPIESQIIKNQTNYYQKIDICNKTGTSNQFIEFMLEMINEALKEIIISIENANNNISYQVNRLLEIMETNIPYSANTLMGKLNIKSKETLRNTYLNPSIENGLIEMTLPDKPNSKNQKYIKK